MVSGGALAVGGCWPLSHRARHCSRPPRLGPGALAWRYPSLLPHRRQASSHPMRLGVAVPLLAGFPGHSGPELMGPKGRAWRRHFSHQQGSWGHFPKTRSHTSVWLHSVASFLLKNKEEEGLGLLFCVVCFTRE
uniref:Uncharacterized protein n=1 Tax=Molossus molossus TaxID=27622 RepID=A0A7J8HGY1_MOLMO|nr:hypothetical protein HJG59_010944 [Molossus molossus]